MAEMVSGLRNIYLNLFHSSGLKFEGSFSFALAFEGGRL